ncbi:flagellar hook-associated protein FlgK [Segnochrobactrum spirostomi]|uniref:Flagellar hook-associated protein 1 n=1 Tax=Segnochrobactrum spirostomi TaxID=2608987 RepID=A0A6A7Y190_9HYPH|nr:flagellar hook-associated protein FlgK [Segnochrobactrum spirostomi]MQT12744.1 flagellar hook-associated protein FlgK [Segnochrobactrum spirostomi]
MSLSAALNTARSSLQSTSTQISVAGRNVAGASDPSYSRKIATTVPTDGGVRTVVTRATDPELYTRMLGATSDAAKAKSTLSGLDQLYDTIGDTQDDTSPGAKIGKLLSSLSTLADQPDQPALATQLVAEAKNVVTTLNEATKSVQGIRGDADSQMASAVGSVNDLLQQFQKLNQQIVAGTAKGADVTDQLDQRDGVLSKLSEQMGITVLSRANNDMAVYTDSGVTLFDQSARTVSFSATTPLTAGATGNAVYVGGVPVTGPGASMALKSGAIAGLATLRDTVLPTYQNQLDEMARTLISGFSEADQSGAGGPKLAGLFTNGTDSTVPGGLTVGLAGTISVNSKVDPQKGGNAQLLRDGGINGTAYTYNTSGASGYADRLRGTVDALNAKHTFDAGTGLPTSVTLSEFGSNSVGWVASTRKAATSDDTYQSALLTRASDALSNATGVNMDDEYANQLQLEKSFAASSKLISIIDKMYETLLGIG